MLLWRRYHLLFHRGDAVKISKAQFCHSQDFQKSKERLIQSPQIPSSGILRDLKPNAMFLDDELEFDYVGRSHSLRDKTLASIPFLYQKSRLYEFKSAYLNFLG